MKNIKEMFALGVIIVFACLIYTFKLSTIPNGFYVDEAVVAYNARSILGTGKDAFGQPHPVLFRLLGSYTPPLFIYTLAILIKFFGDGISVVRSISVFSALVSVIYFYLFIKKLKLYKSGISYYITTLFYAISPWLVFNARLGYEVTLAYTLFNIGIYFLFLSLEKPKNYFWSVVFLSLSTYTAHTQRFLVPIFVFGFILINTREVFRKRNLRILVITVLTLIVLHIPHFTVITTPAFWVKNERFLEQGGQKIFTNIINQTFSYLSTKNIFFELSDIDLQHTVPGLSVMYNWMVIPYLFGLFILFFRSREQNVKFVFLLFMTSLIPAIMSGEFISIQRALPFLLPLMIVIGLGIDKIILGTEQMSFRGVPNKLGRLRNLLTTILFILLLIYSFTLLYRSYFILFPVERAEGWNYGYDKVAEFIIENSNNKYLLDNSRNPRNYILLLYFLHHPPVRYQKEVDLKYITDYYRSLPPENSYVFANINVREIDWKVDSYKDQIIIGDPLTISESQMKDHFLDKIYIIYNPLGDPILFFYKTNPKEKCKASYSNSCW